MMKFFVQKQRIELLERDAIAADQIAFVPLHFVFDGAWEGLYKVVQITQCCETYNLILGTDGKSCLLPSECKAGTIKLSVFGYAPSDTKALRATTIPVSLHIKPSGFVSDSVTPIPPTPDLYAQLLQELEKKAAGLQNGKDGKDGISPAVTVTETETGATVSVTDATGTTTAELHNGTKGDKGDTGSRGADGKSAYEVALQNGFTGTEADWLESLKGQKGDIGEPGAAGAKGDAGTPGKDGVNGKNGVDGYSPIATVAKTDTGATITITDKNGTTTAAVKNGVGEKTAEYGEIFNTYSGEYANKATGNHSHAEGEHTTASGDRSHAEGSYTTASGDNSHAEGNYNTASGLQSHAEGQSVLASGIQSHAEGYGTVAKGNQQHVQGRCNVIDDSSKYAFIIGNGDYSSGRSNAFAIDWNGKIYVNNSTDGVDISDVYYNINELQSRFDDTCSAKTVYVDAVNGSDTQDGSTQANALQTLDKALQRVRYARKAVIYLAAGTYTIPDKTLNLLGQDVRIYGDTAATTIIKGNIVCENSFLLMRRVTIDSSDSTTANATADTITLQYRAAIRMVDCSVITNGKNAVSLTEMSNANLVNTTFQGATQYAVYVTGLSDAKIYTCTDATTKGVRSGGGSIVYINNATGSNFSYANGSNGIVFVDGQQVLPKTTAVSDVAMDSPN